MKPPRRTRLRRRMVRLAAGTGLVLLVGACASVNPFATAPVDPASPIAPDVARLAKTNRAFPKFSDIPPMPTDTRPARAWGRAADATTAARDKLQKIRQAFQNWVWTDPDRTDRLARVYNDRFNNIAPRRFDGSHLKLPGASGAFSLYDHQKRGIWRIVAAGSTYLAHAVGAGKTITYAAAIMEQRRLGLVSKAMVTVPGHCLAQVAREFLALYPAARILVADETNFTKDKRQRFLSRAATARLATSRLTSHSNGPG